MPEQEAVFHFAQPAWLLLLPAIVAVAVWLMLSVRLSDKRRIKVYADEHLLPHLTGTRDVRVRQRWHKFARWALLWTLLVLAMAGPRWDYSDIRLFRPGTNLVILLDISRSMQARDVEPNRLARARQEIEDLLRRNPGIRIGMIAFASVAHVVAPVTEDSESIRRVLPALSSDLVRLQGSRLGEGIERAHQLLTAQPSDSTHAVLLISDGDFVEPDLEAKVRALATDDIRLHVLGIGTTEGDRVPAPQGRWMVDRRGQTIISRLDEGQLKRLASAGRGTYLRADFRDDDTAEVLDLVLQDTKLREAGEEGARVWNENFYWLVGLSMLLLLPSARRIRPALGLSQEASK